jgi:uncharacterized protein (DUF2147 family)
MENNKGSSRSERSLSRRKLLPAISTMVATLISLADNSLAQRAAASAAGLWEKVDASGRPEAWFRIYECRGHYQGQIVRIFPKPGEDPREWKCTKCEGEQKNAPVLGITFIKGMKRNGLRYEGGTILDPRDGSTYQAYLEVSPDGEHLEVRGYVAIPLLGQSEVWRRIAEPGEKQMLPAAVCDSGK